MTRPRPSNARVNSLPRSSIPPTQLPRESYTERVAFPFSAAGVDYLSGEEEHLVMGTFEVVDVHWDTQANRMVVEEGIPFREAYRRVGAQLFGSK